MKKINLFCLPFAGGSKYSYKGYVKVAPGNLNVIPIEIPGRGSRFKEKLLTNLDDMVEDIYISIFKKLDEPYAIYGHSMGTLLTWLLAKKIIRNGHPHPMHLFVSGAGGPAVRQDEKRHLLPKDKFVNKIKELGGSPEEILNDKDLMDFFEPILRADFKAVETFEYKESMPFHIPVSVFIGIDEKTTFEEAMAWQKVTTKEIDVKEFPGKHFFIFSYEKELIDIMSKKLSPSRILSMS